MELIDQRPTDGAPSDEKPLSAETTPDAEAVPSKPKLIRSLGLIDGPRIDSAAPVR